MLSKNGYDGVNVAASSALTEVMEMPYLTFGRQNFLHDDGSTEIPTSHQASFRRLGKLFCMEDVGTSVSADAT